MISEMVRSLEGDEGVFEGSEVAMRATSKRAYVPLLKRVREPALGERAGAANGFCEEAAIQARALGTKSGDSD